MKTEAPLNPVIVTIDFGGRDRADQEAAIKMRDKMLWELLEETKEQSAQIRAQADDIAALRRMLKDATGELGAGIEERNETIETLKGEAQAARVALDRAISYANRLRTWHHEENQEVRRHIGQAFLNIIAVNSPGMAAYIIDQAEEFAGIDSGVITALGDLGAELKESPNDGPGTVDGERYTIGCEILKIIESHGKRDQ